MIGSIDDVSLDSLKNREKYEIQSVLKRPEDSNGEGIEYEYGDENNH